MSRRKRKPIDYSKISTREPAAEEAVNDIHDTSSSPQNDDTFDGSVENIPASEELAPSFELYRIIVPLLNVRQAPSFDSEKAGYFQHQGNIAKIVDKIETDDGSIWGKMMSGYYICLHEGNTGTDFAEKWSK